MVRSVVLAKPQPSGYELLGRFMVGLLAMTISFANFVLRGFVLQALWGWFVTPTFGVQPPGVAVCVGLFLVVMVFREVPRRKLEDKDRESLAVLITAELLSTGVAFGLGWVVHLFV